MNYFEFGYDDIILNQLKLFSKFDSPKSTNLEKYLVSKKIENVNSDVKVSETECWEFQSKPNLLLFGYFYEISGTLQFIIKLFRKTIDRSGDYWISDSDLNLSQLLSKHGIQMKTITFCNNLENSDIVIIFFSSDHSNYLIRYDLQLKNITDLHSFSVDSIFVPCLSNNWDSLDAIIDPGKKISIVLINRNSEEDSFSCPTVCELESVLNERLIIAVKELFRFWLGNISSIFEKVEIDSFNFFHNGIFASQYINFLYVHHFVLLEIILSHCHKDNSSSSLGNQFVEQLSNLTNEYINEAVNIFVKLAVAMQLNLCQLKSKYSGVRRLIDVLCDNGHRFRKLVLSSRWSLKDFKPPSSIKSTNIAQIKENGKAEMDNWKVMDRNTIIKQGLINRNVGALKSYFQKNKGETLTELDIMQQTRLIILSNIDKVSWNELIQLIKKLGYEPVKTLTSLCLETTVMRIRDDIYVNLHLETKNPNYKIAKNLIDKLEDSFDTPDTNNVHTGNSNLYSYIQTFIDRLEKSKCENLKSILTIPTQTTKKINLKLNWFMEFFNVSNSTNDNQELVNMVDLCLMDADYKNLILPFFGSPKIFLKNLSSWILKWINRDDLLVTYLTISNNSDLVVSVIESDMTADCIVTYAIIDQLIKIIGSKGDDQFTFIDRGFAANVIIYLLINQPTLFITKLTKHYENALSDASEIIGKINSSLPLHYMCSNRSCSLNTMQFSDLPLASFMHNNSIHFVISNTNAGEFPIVLYFLLDDQRDPTLELCINNDYAIKSTIQFNSGLKKNSKVDLFQCFLSQNVSNLELRTYVMEELDEILYAALFSGMTYDEIMNSQNDIMVRVNTIFNDSGYWNKLRRRLLRPKISNDESANMEQYYEVNLYNFLHRCGFPVDLNNVFTFQPQNSFTNEISNKQFPTLSYLVTKHHSLFEISKYSLDYVYYLSLGRPYQAFTAIVNEFTDVRKPDIIAQELLKEIVKGIHQVALSNIHDPQIIGACFGLLRLIGSSTESLRCYLTLANWVIDWYVATSEQNFLLTSDGSQLSTDDLRKHYEINIGKQFKLCLSKFMLERKRSRELLLKQMEDMFLYRLKNNFYSQLSEIIDAWSFVLYFCQLQGLEFSTTLLQFYASRNEWLLFLCCSQLFGYFKDQVKLAINKFEDVCIRQHMNYIVSKVEDFSSTTSSFVKTAFSNVKGKNIPARSTNAAELILMEQESKSSSPKSKDNLSKNKTNKFSKTSLLSAAKDNLIELIFDCRINSPIKSNVSETNPNVEPMQLHSTRLLAFSLVLSHPFLSIIAFCSENSKLDQKPEDSFGNYLNCICCFILSSFPKRTMKEFWNKWANIVKIEWTEEETIELIVFAIKNRLTNVVADAFYILQPDKYTCMSSFYSMVSHTVDSWNPVQRESYLLDFIKKCTVICKTNILPKDRIRGKSLKDSSLLFFNRLLEASLLTAMNALQKNFGSRFLCEWLESLSSSISEVNKIHVKPILPVDELNIYLLHDVFHVFYDYIDLDKNDDAVKIFEMNAIPVNIRSKEFMDFVDNLIVKIINVAEHSIDYTKSRLIADAGKLINKINEVPAFVLLHDKKGLWKTKLESLESKKDHSDLISNKSVTDLVSMAFAGQNDKENIVQLCMESGKPAVLLDEILPNSNSFQKVYHGTTDSWRRLVIPEDWEDHIFTISDSKQNSQLEVSHVNSLLNERKWIEACSYMIENDVYVKDALLILISMNVACGKTNPNKLSAFIVGSTKTKKINNVKKDGKFKAAVRRLSVFTFSTSTLSTIPLLEHDSSSSRINRQINQNTELIQKCLRNALKVMIHGQEILEYIYTIYCVANKMMESYLTVAKEEEFNVLTKILIGTCREKIDTADMYLGVVDIDHDQLSRFIADVTIQVLRYELQSNLVSSSVSIPSASASMPHKHSSIKSSIDIDNSRDIRFTISPTSSNSSHRSSISQPRRDSNNLSTYPSNSSLHDYVMKVAQRCQLRPELHPFVKQTAESRLMKAFYLQDLLILSPNHRKLGRILYDYYLIFSQEVFSCREDAEFLVFLLVQCHNCFTDGGDTVGISLILKSAKELSKMLTINSYFVLMAQLLCRIGRYGKMPYIFSTLIEHEHFELLLRKDMDKEGVIVPYVLDYLSRYLSEDFEKIELVCHKYNCYYELAETETKKASVLIKKLKSQSWKNFTKDNLKNTTSTIISNLLESCKNYFKVGCYKKVQENLRKAQFFKLQQKWIEDPEKILAVGSFSTPLGRSFKASSSKVDFPETTSFGGVKLIDMNTEHAIGFLKKIPNFYTAFIIIEHLKLSAKFWIELIVHHVLMNGDETYMLQFLEYFGRVLSTSFVQECSDRYDRLSGKMVQKQHSNLKLVLQHCNDVFLLEDYQRKYQLSK